MLSVLVRLPTVTGFCQEISWHRGRKNVDARIYNMLTQLTTCQHVSNEHGA